MYNGQGDGLTKWKGWSWKLLLIKFVTYYSKKKQLVWFIVFLVYVITKHKMKRIIKSDNPLLNSQLGYLYIIINKKIAIFFTNIKIYEQRIANINNVTIISP